MFWQHIVTSSIDKLFEQPADQLKLQDFLDETDLIQECLSHNQRLLDYLIQENVMNELIQHIIKLPNDDNFRYANVACELLSGDFQCIQEKLLEKNNLDILYSFLLMNNDELNPILASYFSRIISTLINRRPNELIDYLKTKLSFKDDIIRHIYSTSISDITYRLVSDSGEYRSDVIKWYNGIRLVDALTEQFTTTESHSIQANIANLFSELLRLAFDPQSSNDADIFGSILSSTIERLLHNRNGMNDESTLSNQLLSADKNNHASFMNGDSEEKLTVVNIAQTILSKPNLEKLFDGLIKRPTLISAGYELYHSILDLQSRSMSVPKCISLISQTDDSSSNKNDDGKQQINENGTSLTVTESNEKMSPLTNLTDEPLIHIYLTLLEVLPSRLPSLIAILNSSPSPLSAPTIDASNPIKYQFIIEPLGAVRLNLIKFFSKLIQIISNDYAGDKIYEILYSNRLFHTLIDLFIKHIYNNFLHAQIYSIIRLFIHINSLAIKQPNDIWTRAIINHQNKPTISKSSPFYYTNRWSFKSLQLMLSSSGVNLFERLIDQYELNIASTQSITASISSEDVVTPNSLHSSFVSPNSGHIAQILRCLRDHASTYNNYMTFFKSNDDEQIDDDTSVLEIRWQAALDYLNEDENKWSAMHYTERTTSNFLVSSSVKHYANMADSEESDETEQPPVAQTHTFHMRQFGKSGATYLDDEDDDEEEAERLDIDDGFMKNDENSSERKLLDMKKIKFQLQIPTTFDEQSVWSQQDDLNDISKIDYDNDNDDEENTKKINTNILLPDLFENHRLHQERSLSSNESNFEHLCSLKANDNNNISGLFPFQPSSAIRDEAISNDDEFWENHQIFLINANDNQYKNNSDTQSLSSSSDEDNDIDAEDESNIPEDEKFFVHTNMETNETVQPNNMMDIFQRQSAHDNNEKIHTEQDPFKVSNQLNTLQESIDVEKLSSKTLTFITQNNQENDMMDDDNDRILQDNFSFLIAKGLLRPTKL